MNNLRKKVISFLFFVFLICSGCTKKKGVKDTRQERVPAKILNETFQVIGKDKDFMYHLPDTIGLKDTLKGYIVYKSDFDTIVGLSDKTYFVNFYFAKTKELSKNFREFQTKKSDTFARIHDSIIPIYDITFKTKGSHLFEGYIKDYLYFDTGNDSLHFKSLESHVMYRVYVE